MVSLPADHADRPEPACTTCHTGTMQPTIIAHPSTTQAGCGMCHGNDKLAAVPANHEERSNCVRCHGTYQLPAAHEASLNCTSCHSEGRMTSLPTSHAGRTQETCVLCHRDTRQVPEAPHTIADKAACSACHNGKVLSVLPASLSCRSEQACAECLSAVPTGVPPIMHKTEGRSDCVMCHTK